MPRLLSVGEIIDRTWEHYKVEFVGLLSVSGWILIAAIVDLFALIFYPTVSKLALGATLTNWESFGVALFAFSNYGIASIINLWVFAALSRLVSSQLSGRGDNVNRAMQEGGKFFLPLAYIGILIGVLLFGAVALSFAPSVGIALLGMWTNMAAAPFLVALFEIIGVCVAIFLCFRWSVQYFLAPYTLLVDGVRGWPALVQARRMVDGRFWSIFLRLAVPKALFILFGVVGMQILISALSLVTVSAAGSNIDLQARLGTIVLYVVMYLATAVINPLIVIADVLLYRSLKNG
jgi:hypothetical protein